MNNTEINNFQYQINEDVMTRHGFPLNYTNETKICDDIVRQNTIQDNTLNCNEITDWTKGCQIVGFIPDHPLNSVNTLIPNYPASTSSYNFPSSYQNKRKDITNSYDNYSTKPVQTHLRASLKRKRKRTVFTTEQIVALEEVFRRKPYINREEREAMMNRLQVSERAIKVWFQNRRRINVKTENTLDSPPSMETPDSFSERLSSIEAQIRENTDDNGHVTLNDDIMSELVSVIDDRLSQDISLLENQTSVSDLSINKEKDIVMYEPISPVSSEDINENTIDHKSGQSWNVLDDIQSVLFV